MGYVKVTEKEFFARMNPLNVNPRPTPMESVWEMLDGSRRVIGKSTPGYRYDGPEEYFLSN